VHRFREGALTLLLPPYRWLFSRWIELRGNVVDIEGCKFNLDSPSIQRKNRFLFNHYEPAERLAAQKFLDPSLAVIELGGAIGILSCIVNRRLSSPERHVTIEANPELLGLLADNKLRNGSKFHIVHSAIAYGAPELTFYINANFTASSLTRSEGRAVLVPATTLGRIADEYCFNRFTLFCDIEGGERDLIQQEADVLRTRVSMLFIEIHSEIFGDHGCRGMTDELKRAAFDLIFKSGDDYVFRNRSLASKDSSLISHKLCSGSRIIAKTPS
jgi:FkbM family methyltransferase